MQSNNNLEKLVLCIQPSLRINLTFWSQLQLSAKSARSSSETCWIDSHDMMKSPKLETLTSMQQRFYKRASVLFARVRFKSGHYWSSDTTADQKNSKSPICQVSRRCKIDLQRTETTPFYVLITPPASVTDGFHPSLCPAAAESRSFHAF